MKNHQDHSHDAANETVHEHEHKLDANQNQPIKKTSCCSDSTCAQAENITFKTEVDIPKGWHQSKWHVPQLDCPTEEGMVRKKMQNQDGIQVVHCNTMKGIVTIAYQAGKEQTIENLIRSLGFDATYLEEGKTVISIEAEKPSTVRWAILALSGVLAVGAELLHSFHFSEWLTLIAAIASIMLCGLETFKNGLLAIRNKNLNINALMSVAVIGAILIKQWPEAAMVMFLFTIAEMLEAYSLTKAKQTIKGLMALTPETVTLLSEDGQWQDTPASKVQIGAIARVKPGERIALDGIITSGFSTINQSPITGESVPVEKQVNDPVFAGTINESGSFEFKVTALAQDTTLAKIIDAVENAQNSRAPTQSFIDKFASYYIPAVFVLALIVAFVIPLFVGNWIDWIYKGLVLLVISCPCALVISTPVTIVSALSLAAKRGILIKGGVYLEMGRKINWLAVDKTGTLTHGRPEQTDYISFTDGSTQTHAIAASLADRSDHPVSVAIIRQAKEAKVDLFEVSDFKAIAGFGTQGIINGDTYYLVNQRYITQNHLAFPDEIKNQVDTLQHEGKTIVLLCNNEQILGCFAVADTVKEEVKETINSLHNMGIKTLMITGDNQDVANAVANEVGIDEVYAEQLPEHKLSIIESKQTQVQTIAMVGDGINDAPALAQANVGIAMGQLGTDTAVETADIVLMDDKLSKIVEYIKISKKSYVVLMQNISFALGVKLVFIILTLFGLSSMWMAVFADVGTTLLVVFNGLRVLFMGRKVLG